MAKKKKSSKKLLKPQEPSPYQLGGLYKTHWPEWDVNSKAEHVTASFDWTMSVRYRTGEYSPSHKGYPIYITEHANSSSATTTTRIYVPARYRPILRLLNAKMAWHMISFTVGSPKVNKDHTEKDAVAKRRYEVWMDGVRRNIIYCGSIREAFFEWIEIEYYGGKEATGLVPKPLPMDGTKRCIDIESWMMHELVVGHHVRPEILLWGSTPENVQRWQAIGNVFDLGLFYLKVFFSLAD